MASEDDFSISVKGLSSRRVGELIAEYGPNTIEEKKRSVLWRIWKAADSPVSFMFIAAAGLSSWAGESGDAVIIAVLFLINIGVGVWHEAKADNALDKLKEKLAVTVKVRRDGAWKEIPSAGLVPGDVIELAAGDLIPADIQFLDVKSVTSNEAVVTGESLPKEKKAGDKGYSGAFVSTGLCRAMVAATGARTYFGTTMTMVDSHNRRSRLERDILSISRFLSVSSVIVIAVLTAVLAAARQSMLDISTLDVSMLIAGVPVALSTIMTIIISVGVTAMARKSVIVRRLSSLEDLSDVNLLLSDKTGTLSENKIKVTGMVLVSDGQTEERVWSLASAAAPRPDSNPLDAAIRAKAEELKYAAAAVQDFIPGDSERKRTTAFIGEGGKRSAVALGAPQTIRDLSLMDAATVRKYDDTVAEAAGKGFRVLVLAEAFDEREKDMRPLAVFFLADAVRPEARDTIAFMNEYGIAVKMVTGDGRDVAAHVAGELGLRGRIVNRDELISRPDEVERGFAAAAGFAEVMPKDKYDLVMMAKGMRSPSTGVPYTVAVTGDGVNDVPPVKAADVGFAVSNAVDALKGSADIVLASPGIAVIKDAIVEARKIFMRLSGYSLYRTAESFRLIMTIGMIGIILRQYPLTPVLIIFLALLNDIPIISLAFDRVTVSKSVPKVDQKSQLILSSVLGLTGLANSLLLLWLSLNVFHVPWPVIQTGIFLNLTVSGHALVYVTHTEKPWFRFLPSAPVIWATILTQVAASVMAYMGLFTASMPLASIAFIWLWCLAWMQATELAKQAYIRFAGRVAAV